MTVVNSKSISGINSITTGSGSDNLLTIHSSDSNNTERLRIDSTGTTRITTGIVTTFTATSSAKVGSGVTLSPDGDVFATGVCTATSFSGDGSNLTGISAGTALSGSTDNTVCTVTGANAIQGESNLTFTGDILQVSSTTQGLGARFTNTGNEYTNIQFSAARTAADNALGILNAKWDNNHEVAAIYLTTGDDTTNKDDGKIKFYTSAASGTLASRMEILNDGNVKVSDGDLVIGTSGHGIDFSATGQASGMTSELLDDYEEGTHTLVPNSNLTLNASYNIGEYTKVGNVVTMTFLFFISSVSSTTQVTVSLPFACKSGTGSSRCDAIGSVMHNGVNTGSAGIVSYIAQGSSTITFYNLSTNGGWAALNNSDLNANDEMYVTVVYRAA